MKKTKLIMPIIGIAAIGSSIAPLTTLTSCNKGQEFKVELVNDTQEKDIYSNYKVENFYFKQNIVDNCNKTKAKMVNLKVNSAEVQTVAGLVKTITDSASNIKVTIDLETLLKHYSNPSTIEFDLLFTNKANNVTYSIEGFKINVSEEIIPYPFTSVAGEATTLKGFVSGFDLTKAAKAYTNIFQTLEYPFEVLDEDGNPITLYKMTIPSEFTAIADDAFYKDAQSLLPQAIRALDFTADSQMEKIGAESFAWSSLTFVNLPKSLRYLEPYCFAGCKLLTSVKFPSVLDSTDPTATIELGEGCLTKTSIPYLKLPNYITSLGDEGKATLGAYFVPCILDFTEWSPAQISALAENGMKRGSFEQNNVVYIFAHTADDANSLKNGFVNKMGVQILDATNSYGYESPYQQTIAISSIGPHLAAYITTIGQQMLELQLPWRFEMPNFVFVDDSKLTVSAIVNAAAQGGEMQQLIQLASSLVLPESVASYYANELGLSPYLWQVYIPAAVDQFSFKLFGDDAALCSIIYGGTIDQWKAIMSHEYTSADWHIGCPKITVRCADGNTVTVEPLE